MLLFPVDVPPTYRPAEDSPIVSVPLLFPVESAARLIPIDSFPTVIVPLFFPVEFSRKNPYPLSPVTVTEPPLKISALVPFIAYIPVPLFVAVELIYRT